jgi:hypothetical protein
MNTFLELSLWNGLLAMCLGISIPGILIVFIVRKLIVNKITKQHERVGRLLFRVTASLLALLISLSYANEKIGYNKVVNSLEVEAAIIASVMLKLKLHRSELAEQIREDFVDYVQYTIDDGWRKVIDDPYRSKMWGTIYRINIKTRALPEVSEMQKLLKASIIADTDAVTKTFQVRVYSSYFHLPYLTYILAFGLMIVWCFFSVYRLDIVSISFLTLYNIFLAVLLYFVIMLGNPLVGPLKIDPAPFHTLKEMGLERLPF